MDNRSNVTEGGAGGAGRAKAGPLQHQYQHHNHHHLHQQSTTSPVCGGTIASEFSKSSLNNDARGDVSLDTPSSIDTPQQDSGSNQSGSDSGLGYTNSLSSDNSTFNNAKSQDRIPAAAAITTSAAATLVKIENNNMTIVKNKGPIHMHSTNSATSTTSKFIDSGPASSVYPNKKSESSCFVVGETRTTHGSSLSLLVNNRRKSSAKDDQQQQPSIDSEKKSAQAPTSRTTAPSSPPSNLTNTGERCTAVLKSLLKKTLINNSSIDAPPCHSPHKERKRRVTFNQTVIVFCEELGAPVLSGPDEHQQPFEPPPPDYQDPLCSFGQPEDYCDQEEVVSRKEGSLVTSAAIVAGGDDYIDKVEFHHPIIDSGASNLTDDQLFGLLENESLLESFKINCDEDLSDEDFPAAHLSKLNLNNQNGLANEAVSDYDSDSESSLYYDRKDTNALPILSTQNPTRTNATNYSTKHEQPRTLNNSTSLKNTVVLESQEQEGDKSSSNEVHVKTYSQKSAPARVKVSTVDNNHKRNSTRKEESDLKSKMETNQNECSNSKLQQQQHHNESIQTLRPEPMLIRQSVVEPMAFSKSTMVSSVSDESRLNSISSNSQYIPPPLLTNNKPAQANVSNHSEHNYHLHQQRLVNSLNQKTQQPNLPNSNFDHNADSQSCTICKVIESKKPRSSMEVKQNQPQATANQTHKNEINLAQPGPMEDPLSIPRPTLPNQQAVYNESCVSCREASMKNNSTNNMYVKGGAGILHGTGSSQQTRPQPLDYQLVYVVDQNGNRVRALSVVRSNLNTGAGQQPIVGKRIFVAQNGLRFPYPGSIGTAQLVNVSNTSQQSHTIAINGQPVQYKIVGTAQQYPMQQIRYLQNQNASIKTTSNDLDCRTATAPALLPHTVYYVRQPLEPRTTNQSREVFGNSSRSFPDPHEIRRLDGIRGPTANLNLSNKRLDLDHDENSSTRQPGMSRDETGDDPTFGFSQRPSVKVVATTNSHQAGSGHHPVKIVGQNLVPLSNNTYTICHAPTSGQLQQQKPLTQRHHDRPISVVLMGSQTLDRRHLNQQQMAKENMSSTSSMTNIHGIFAKSNPYPNKLITTSTASTTNANVNSQQQRISDQTNFELSIADKPLTKASRLTESDSVCLENNTGVIETGKVIVPLIAQGRQTSSLINHRYKRTQEQQAEVLYSMNV